MAKGKQSEATKPAPSAKENGSRTAAIAERGIHDAASFADVMSAMMSDVVTGRLTPEVCNATCNAGGKLLKVVEMTYKYGKKHADRPPTLQLTQ